MTTPRFFTAAAAAVLGLTLLACRDGNSSLRRQTEGYEVVDEGSASGANSTILGQGGPVPGAPTPIPPLDFGSTNVDTTTAFTTLQPAIGTAAPAPTAGTLADTLPPVGSTPTARPLPPAVSRPATAAPEVTPAATPTPSPIIDIRRSEPEPTPTATPEDEPQTDEGSEQTPTETTSTEGGSGNEGEGSGF